jgi:hypothetical protein
MGKVDVKIHWPDGTVNTHQLDWLNDQSPLWLLQWISASMMKGATKMELDFLKPPVGT